jgi:lantibiotic modifying enzyme
MKKVIIWGLSHGIASIIKILGKAVENGIHLTKSQEMLSGSVDFLLNNIQDPGRYLSYFPNWSLNGDAPQASRLAWCYGDLGISAALLQASFAAKNSIWKSKAIEIQNNSATRRDLPQNGVKDFGLCHGTSGIAHIFNRIYSYSGLEEFCDASEYWYHETMKMLEKKNRVWGLPFIGL